MECTATGYRFFRPVDSDLGVVPLQLDILQVTSPVPEEAITNPEIWEVVGQIEGEAGRSLARMITRYMRLGVVFDTVTHRRDLEYHQSEIIGWRKRSDTTLHLVKITNRHIDLADPTLAHYHRYYTK